MLVTKPLQILVPHSFLLLVKAIPAIPMIKGKAANGIFKKFNEGDNISIPTPTPIRDNPLNIAESLRT